MKKSSIVALLPGTLGGCLFALGMCMVLVAEWGAIVPGVVVGCIGLVFVMGAVLAWRRIEGKAPIHVSKHVIGCVAIGVTGGLLLGTGMALSMVSDVMVLGIAVGIVGIFVLVALVPFARGVK